MRKAKAQIELNLVRDAKKNSKNGFTRYTGQKRSKGVHIPSDKLEGERGFNRHGNG